MVPRQPLIPDTDKEGFLLRLEDWDENVASQLAEKAQIELTPAHWEVISLVRDYYGEYKLFPVNRVLVSRLRDAFGEEKGTSIHLMQLFTGKPRRYIAMISGLPKPRNCD